MTKPSLLKRSVRLEYGEALPDAARKEGDVPVMSSGGVTGSHDRPNTHAPCIVVGRKGSFGSVHWSDVPSFVIDTAYYVDERTTSNSLRWLYYALQTLDLRSLSQDVGVPGLSRESVHSINLVVPDIAVQRQIAGYLDNQVALIDAIIRLREEQVVASHRRLDVLIRDVVAGGEEGGHIPAQAPWVGKLHPQAELRPLSRSLVLQRGVDLTAEQRVAGQFPVITTGGVVGTHNRSIAEGPGVVIGRYGTVGNVHWVDSAFWPHNTTLYVKDFRGNDPRWLYWLLRAFPYEMQQARAAVPGVNRNEMHPVLMPWLPLNLQRKSATTLDEKDSTSRALADEMRTQITLLKERKQSLITAAVTGEFDVSAASGCGVT